MAGSHDFLLTFYLSTRAEGRASYVSKRDWLWDDGTIDAAGTVFYVDSAARVPDLEAMDEQKRRLEEETSGWRTEEYQALGL